MLASAARDDDDEADGDDGGDEHDCVNDDIGNLVCHHSCLRHHHRHNRYRFRCPSDSNRNIHEYRASVVSRHIAIAIAADNIIIATSVV